MIIRGQIIEGGYIIPYIDSTYSSLLHLLYVHVSPEFPWYGTCLLIVLGISAATLVGVTVALSPRVPGLLLVLLMRTLFPRVVTVDYSMASMGSAGAVAAALVLLLRDALTGLRALLLGLLATVSMWLRLDGIVATAAFTAPVVLTVFILCLRRQAGRNVFKYAPLLLCAVPLAASFTVDSIHKVYYSSPQYREYVEWSNLRGAFHADPISRINYDNPAVLSATGWSKADYDNLMGWFFIDENLYNVQSMTAFFDTAKKSSITAYPAEYFLDNLRIWSSGYGVLVVDMRGDASRPVTGVAMGVCDVGVLACSVVSVSYMSWRRYSAIRCGWLSPRRCVRARVHFLRSRIEQRQGHRVERFIATLLFALSFPLPWHLAHHDRSRSIPYGSAGI